ncbi:hypothetical protein SADUNF_Sadunf03G0134000 [Salix dunnii]|uniref:Uncharacterized protein n=1 Tax=Salix dunnii TaxID=1413687 RepID=A0A835N4P1_9ROSI|nr:hypothetical protein SADUNF_Sadunf03G0134000 [Salix dunnii]
MSLHPEPELVITRHYNLMHGTRQLRSGGDDGPPSVTRCPIRTEQSYGKNYTIGGQKKHSLVACPYIMAKTSFLWSLDHSSQTWHSLSVCQALQRSSHHLWIVVQCRSRRNH